MFTKMEGSYQTDILLRSDSRKRKLYAIRLRNSREPVTVECELIIICGSKRDYVGINLVLGIKLKFL